MCEKCREMDERAVAFVTELYDWEKTLPDQPLIPDGLRSVAAKSASEADKSIENPQLAELVGHMVIETVRVAYLAGLRAAREADAAPTGEGALAEVMMIPVQQG